jgi:hypothetical protein
LLKEKLSEFLIKLWSHLTISWPTSRKIKFALICFVVVMMLYPAMMSSRAVTYDATPAHLNIKRDNPSNNPNLILFKRGALDTRASRSLDTSADEAIQSDRLSTMSQIARKQMRIVQFAGPIKRKWVEQLQATGSEIIGYIPNNAYIIRGSGQAMAQAAALDSGARADDDHPIQWMGRFNSIQKLDPVYTDDMLASGINANVDVEIELFDAPETAGTIERINALALRVNREPRRFLSFVVLSVTIPVERLLAAADLDEVLFISPAPRFETHDERSAQIVAGNLSADGTQPTGPGYMAWLASKGLDTQPDFVVDFTDTGLDRSSTSSNLIHPDFLDAEGRSRVAYITNYAADQPDDRGGHGSLVASIACGFGTTGMKDGAGYLYGLGVDPTARLGASRIFDQAGKLPFRLSFTAVASSAYAAGARLSNNSWGNGGNVYDATAQEYDSLVRDAQPAVTDNQEMTFVFSAGNGGPGGHISSPGTAKNIITVAASENYRPEGVDSCNLDGAGGIGPEGADSALDILRYSAGGLTFDGRVKPDIAAPGTHVYGTASQARLFNGDGLCPGVPLYQPPGQQLYTWSSGTSIAAPHITGAAALARKFFISRNLLGEHRAPSPAMTKAYLINSASYLTGENAGGNLPSERQGWGGANLARAFDDVNRALVDQTTLLTESGQAFEIQGSLADRAQPLRVTLVWTDAPGALAGAALVNDLDLEITVGGVTIYRGNNFTNAESIGGGEADRLNNVESIFLPATAIPEGAEGNFKITVRAANIAGDGVPGNGNILDQDFALVVYNIEAPVPPPPPKKVPIITATTYVKKRITITGRDFTRAARIEINGKIIEREFEFNSATNSFSLKLKYKKLNLNKVGDNQIVLIENGERSQAFTLSL